MFASKLLVLTVLSLQAWDSMGLVYKQKPLPKPHWCAHEPGCYSPITDKVLPFGVDVYPVGICKKLSCARNGYTAVHSCNNETVPSGCRLAYNNNLQYPHCCGKVVCDYDYDEDYDYDFEYDYEPIAHRGDYEPIARRGDYEPIARRGDYEPIARRGDYEPIARRGDYEPIARRGDYEPIARPGDDEPIARRGDYVYADELDYEENEPEPRYIEYHPKPVYYRKPAPFYDDGRGDDYKLQEDTKVLSDDKNETSRRAPWNKNEKV